MCMWGWIKPVLYRDACAMVASNSRWKISSVAKGGKKLCVLWPRERSLINPKKWGLELKRERTGKASPQNIADHGENGEKVYNDYTVVFWMNDFSRKYVI